MRKKVIEDIFPKQQVGKLSPIFHQLEELKIPSSNKRLVFAKFYDNNKVTPYSYFKPISKIILPK